ncbi:cyclodeaminase/cyclohydrolase family protein [Desertivirga arenae]|uniref:cyclodeaminase/cyclohydrolase family protein n=1 Tax=Desertivirga arenae TaxID=2810309 RepID=UPI001A969E70|nr:cyclodeaminase/cyclohydrolase family protein [Pedobacter sp. SYSU D00823]
MTGSKNLQINGSVWKMALKQFSDATTKSSPAITGGCVVTTIAGLAMTLLIMPLEVSAKKNEDQDVKALLKEKIAVLKKIKKRLVRAADRDLDLYDQYRFMKTGSRGDPAGKSKYKALIYATKSPFKVASLLKECLSASIGCVNLCHDSVVSDVKAAVLLLHSSFNAILALAQSNMKGLNKEDYKLFEALRFSLEEEVSVQIDTLIREVDMFLLY